MAGDRNPQARQMADESMVRGLAAQAAAIWPQESALIRAYALPAAADVLDIGCGTGEIVRRLGELLPQARLTGVDLIAAHLERAREASAALGDRVTFRVADAFELDLPDHSFDLTVNRHMLQSIPEPERVLAEMKRVTRPGGRLHVLSEDYAMIHFSATDRDHDRFWLDGPVRFAESLGTDLRFGRKTWAAMKRLGLDDVSMDYVTVDTLRVPRATFREIWVAWADGYTEVIAERTALDLQTVRGHFEGMIACLDDPEGYAVWQIPIVSARVP